MSAHDFGVIYRCYDVTDRLIYIGSTGDIYPRINVHIRQSPFGNRIAKVLHPEWTSIEEARVAEAAAIAAERPILNQRGNPDYAGLTRSQQRDLFAASLAAVPVSPECPSIDYIDPVAHMARQRDALERAWKFMTTPLEQVAS